ncbi:MAG: hypothetical protein HQL20_05935 [Candidatus Omnitrophica bacterium]|nr:hypothetical protein [Candidatus Omnitrophota bacterium]
MSDLRNQPPRRRPEVIPAVRPFSNFEFIESRFPDCKPLQRILSLARLAQFSTIVMEEIDSVGISKEDDSDLVALGVGLSLTPLYRLSFFSARLLSVEDINKVDPQMYLGYAILKSIPVPGVGFRWIVFESVTMAGRHDNNYCRVGKLYEVLCSVRKFRIFGTIYCQQNALSNVCAHVALRTCIAAASEKMDDIGYGQLNEILRSGGMPHALTQGLSDVQIRFVFDHLGLKYTLNAYDVKTGKGKIPFQKYLYGSIESGFPALLGLDTGTSAHIIPVLGHTFNEDTWVPNAETSYFKISDEIKYVPSETWVSTYICHDDNFGPHYCLPRHYLSEQNKILVVGLNSPYVRFDSIEAEVIAIECLNKIINGISVSVRENIWLRRLRESVMVQRGWVVLRPILLTGDAYIKHLEAISSWEGQKIKEDVAGKFKAVLTGRYWVVEISLPELFPANKRKLGEIVLDAQQEVAASCMFARLPGELILPSADENQQAFLVRIPTGIDSHTELLQ